MEQHWRAPLADADLEAFERRHGLVLPPAYRSLLGRHEGGLVSRMVRALDGRTVLLMQLVRLEFAEKTAGRFFDGIGRGLLPIGIDGGGDYFLLDLRTGAVKYWDHHADQFNATADDLPIVATDVDDLIRRLEPA